MKKILSFVLVLAMIASMMCVSVSAETEKTLVVGNGTVDAREGVDSVPAGASKDAVITANVSTNIKPKYAIELMYTESTISVNNEATWNVQTLKYEGTTTITVNGAAKTFTSGANTEAIADVANFTVTNYSSKGITVKANVKAMGGVTFSIVGGGADIATATANIDPVTPKEGASADPVVVEYTASMDSEDWAATFAATPANTSVEIATITFVFGAQ